MIHTNKQNTWTNKASSHPGGSELTERMLLKAEQGGWLHKRDYILDIGCGGGATVSLMRQRGYLAAGIDTDADRPDLFRGDAGALPWPAYYFDGIIAECTMSVIRPVRALPEISRVLKPSGLLLLSDIYEMGNRPVWPEEFHFQVLYLENATPLLRSYISALIWETGRPCPPCYYEGRKVPLDRLGYYWAILRLTEGG